jgi:polygalacturonase
MWSDLTLKIYMTLLKRRDFLKAAGAVAVTSSGSFFSLHGAENVPRAKSASNRNLFDARDFGAAGDGKTKDTSAIQQAIDRCHVMGGGEVFLSSGNYLTGAIQLRSQTTLRIDHDAVLLGSPDWTDYPVTQVRWEGKWIAGHIGLVYAIDAEQIAVTGSGKIIGNPALGGRPNQQDPLRHPALIELISCRNVRLEGFSTSYERMWSVHPTYCEDVTIRNLTIRSSGGNGDGIDVDSCKRVWIDHCDISTGDDCISLKSGRGSEGHSLMRTTEDVRITNCTFADSLFACIGIGSETSAGIRNVRIEHCRFTHARSYAIYIKSREGRGAFIKDIVADDLDVSGMEGGFLRINLLSSGLQDQAPVPGSEGIPSAENFRFSNIRVDDVPVLVKATEISPEKPLHGFVLENVTGTCQKGVFLAHAKGARFRNLHLTGYTGTMINLQP